MAQILARLGSAVYDDAPEEIGAAASAPRRHGVVGVVVARRALRRRLLVLGAQAREAAKNERRPWRRD